MYYNYYKDILYIDILYRFIGPAPSFALRSTPRGGWIQSVSITSS